MNDTNHRDIIFLLGAGASIKADVPDTCSFVDQFVESIKDNGEKEAVDIVIKELKEWKSTHGSKGKVDIELLLETLTRLKNRDNEALLQFYDPRFNLDYDFSLLIDDLKNFIKRKAIVSEEQLNYLEPLIEFIEEVHTSPLDIISLNYDICIEQFCNIHKLTWNDGFDVHWNPSTLKDSNSDVHLYKLHGSVMWYKSDRGDYIKLPVMTGLSEIQLITGEKAENLMLYPMQKWDYIEPIFELLLHIKGLLESKECKYVISVGYSFRDDHIRDILWDVARKNKDLHLIIVDPNAYSLYNKRLKYYDNTLKNKSSLDGKVICLPYKFEEILPFYLRNHYLSHLRYALRLIKELREKELSGHEFKPQQAIRELAQAEFTEKVEEILPKLEYDIDNNWELILDVNLRMALNLSANNRAEESSKYFKKFNDILYTLVVERIKVEIVRDGSIPDRDGRGNDILNMKKYIINLYFNYAKYEKNYGQNRISDFVKLFDEFNPYCDIIKKMSTLPENMAHIDLKIKLLYKYFDNFRESNLTLEKYYGMMIKGNKSAELKELFEEFNKNVVTQNTLNDLRAAIEMHEKGLLKDIFKFI